MAESPDAELRALVLRYMDAADWAAAHAVVKAHQQELLSLDIEPVVEGLIAEAADDMQRAHLLAFRGNVLFAARTQGLEAVFNMVTAPVTDDLRQSIAAFVGAVDNAEARAVLERTPLLMMMQTEYVLENDIQAALQRGEEQQAKAINLRLETLRRAREVGYDAAFSEAADLPDEELAEFVMLMVNAGSLEDTKRVVKDCPDLLRPEADDIFKGFIQVAQQEGNQRTVEVFEGNRELLRLCREMGVDEGFAEMQQRISGGQIELERPFDVIALNTIAVMTVSPHKRGDWFSGVHQMQVEYKTDEQMVTLMKAIARVLNGEPPSYIKPRNLKGQYAACWQRIVTSLG